MSRVCNKCGIEKPESELVKSPSCIRGVRPLCIMCRSKQWANCYQTNKEGRVKQASKYQKERKKVDNWYRENLKNNQRKYRSK